MNPKLKYQVVMYTNWFDARNGKTKFAPTAFATTEDAVAWIESRASQPQSCGAGTHHWVGRLGGEEFHYVLANREGETNTFRYCLPCPYPQCL